MRGVAELTVSYELAVARPGPSDGLDAEIAWSTRCSTNWSPPRTKRFNVELVEPGAERRAAASRCMRENAIKGASSDAHRSAGAMVPAGFGRRVAPGGQPAAAGRSSTPTIAPKFAEGRRRAICTTIFRASSLSRLAAASDYKPDEVSVEFQIMRSAAGTVETLAKLPCLAQCPATRCMCSPGTCRASWSTSTFCMSAATIRSPISSLSG